MPSVAVELHARFITRMSVAEVGESSQLLQYSLREVQGRPWTVLRSTVSSEGGGLKVSVALGRLWSGASNSTAPKQRKVSPCGK
jgi:hypothetical protein